MTSLINKFSVSFIGDHLKAQVQGDPHFFVSHIASVFEATYGSLTFVFDSRHAGMALASDASVLVVSDILSTSKIQIVVKNPKRAMVDLIHLFYPHFDSFVTSLPLIDRPSCAQIHPSVSIAQDCVIGKNVRIMANCVIGSRCVIGDDVCLYPHVVLYDDVHIGSGTCVHSGAVLGADGFGYDVYEGKLQKIPHIGFVRIGKAVDIGANTCVDRGCLGGTYIGDGTKIDNLVHVAHNVRIGQDCVIVGQVAIAGSVEIGDHVTIGGHVAIASAVKIGNGVKIAGKSGVTKDCQAGETISGFPAWNHQHEIKKEAWLRQQVKKTIRS